MNQVLSSRIRSLSPSATFEMSRRSRELTSRGVSVIDLAVGEPDLHTPQFIKEAAEAAIEDNFTKYSPVSGFGSLKEAVVHKLQVENGLSYSPSEIVISSGAKQSICNAIQALVDTGDEVIIPAPYWVSYPQMVKLAGGVPVFVDAPIEQGFRITPAQLRSAITPKTRLIIICSPCNPSGAVYSAAELEALAEVVKEHDDLLVLSDEIYEHINYIGSHASIAAVPGMRERTLVVNGVSKAYAMTGWRIGFLAAPKWIISACDILQGQYTSGPCSISQKAAEAAWMGPQECVEQMRLSFLRRRNLLVKLMREIPGLEVNEPQGAFYLLPKCSGYYGTKAGDRVIENSTDLAMYLLEEGHVATVPGSAFGAPDCLRLSYATSDENIMEAVDRIKCALAALKRD
ncbi:MAG: pyridoxal phosphate-dependent aminotransferase [Bacteroidales bacterium]|nr:pyridoxal phosphate-dependent aminotransferase [Bacteroidales bacterium]MBQ3942340.1 pyridoxal phosphate-dependent aminotransferase [Bacteroidales bacterium]